jgi:peroxiredoxin
MTAVLAGHTAPTFTLTEVNGKSYALADALRAGPAVITFFKISCPVCQFTFPFLERMHQAYGPSKVSFWGISQDDARDTKDFNREYGITFPSLLDGDNFPVSNQYGLTIVPTVLLIAPDGKVLVSFSGFDKKELEKISLELGKHLGKPAARVFKPGESVPDYKPG